MSEGVEWALHSCLNLAWVGPERAVTSTRLAEYYQLPAGLLGPIGADLAVSDGAVALMVTVSGLVAAVSAPVGTVILG